MRRFLTLLLLISFSSVDLAAQAIVSDPSLLAELKLHYVEAVNQVSKMTESVQIAQEQINKTDELRQVFSVMRTEMSTIYNNTFGLIGELERLRQQVSQTPNEIQKLLDEIKANVNCLFSDFDSYKQVETLYKARYVFKDEYGGTPDNPNDDPYIWKNQQDMAGSFVPVQLQENPCGHTVTYFSTLKASYEEQRSVIERILFKYNKTQDEIEENQKFYDEMEKKISSTETEKETLDTMKVVLWKMNSHLESIDQTFTDVSRIYLSSIHNPNSLVNAPGISDTAAATLASQGVELGVANKFREAFSSWSTLSPASQTSFLR